MSSVPARLGKGQGAKEIGHNLARKKSKFGHNLVRKRHKIVLSLERERPSEAHFYAWTTKIRSQSSTRTEQGLSTILWAIDENMGTNLQTQAFLNQLSENTTAITFCKCKKKKKLNTYFGGACKSGRAQASTTGRRNMPSWNTDVWLTIWAHLRNSRRPHCGKSKPV